MNINFSWRMMAIGVLLVALVVAGRIADHYRNKYHQVDKSWQLKWAQRDKDDSDALAQRQASERAEEQRRQQAANQAVKDAEKDNEQLKADAINAKRSADRLQQQLIQLRQQFADSETGKLSSAASSSASKSQAIILLPSCSANQTKQQESMQKRLTALIAPDEPVNAPILHLQK